MEYKNNKICCKCDKSFEDFFDRKDIKNEIEKIEKVLFEDKSYDFQFYPLPNEVLRFATLSLDNIKYIILGMDPYPSDYIENGVLIPIATGRSFEVRSLKSWLDNFKQSSLQNILKALYVNEMYGHKIFISCNEYNTSINNHSNILINKHIQNNNNIASINMHDEAMYNQEKNVSRNVDKFNKNENMHKNSLTLSNIKKEIKDGTFKILPPKLLFDDFEKNGVMFLNSTLTVKPHLPNSHTSLWADFMDELIKYIVSYKEDNGQNHIKWFIWGENARNRVDGLVDKKDIIYTCHPASRVNNTFVKDNCFQYM